MNRAERRAAKKRADDKRAELRNNGSTPAQRHDKVCIGVPHRGVTDEFFDSVMSLVMNERDRVVAVVSVGGSLVAPARNAIVRHALQSDADWILQLDSDMSFDGALLDGLLAYSDPVERPIVGGLAFKVFRDGTTEPTMYRLVNEPKTHLQAVRDWQRGALVRVDATGGACLLVHRSVYEAMDAPWFGPAELAGEELGEDVSFCLSARLAGFEIHVASDVLVGHVKPFAFGLADWDRRRREDAAIPTFVVVPVREAGDPMPVSVLSDVISGVIQIPNSEVDDVRGDCPSHTLAKWNRGAEWARGEAMAEGFDRWNVLYLNDDVVLDADRVAVQLSNALRADPSYALAYPNYHGVAGSGLVTTTTDDPAGLTFSGWAFMTRGESALPFDERYVWFYGDNAYEKSLNAAGKKVVCVLDCHVEHLRPNEATLSDPALIRQAIKDEALFAAEYGIDPSTLYLASNPGLLEQAEAASSSSAR